MPPNRSGSFTPPYIGRFAPSPSGPLHFGSLVCALASYLDAKYHQGKWLVRMEDIDPPREQVGANKCILDALLKHGLAWDDTPLYQSTRFEAYTDALNTLNELGLSYRCQCTRKRLASLNHAYDGHCRTLHHAHTAPASIRINTAQVKGLVDESVCVIDQLQGAITENFSESGDFVIHRKDGLFAYQLAVTVDDIYQGITHIVRGSDLLDSTPKQALLFSVFDAKLPHYAHIPVIVDASGNKLSKQNHAKALDCTKALDNLKAACKLLNLEPAETCTSIEQLLSWAIDHWQPEQLKNKKQCFVANSALV